MAAFEVPIATGLFTGIPHDIATAPGAMLPGQAIGNLADAYWSGQNQAYLQRNRDLFKNGIPADLSTALLQAQGAAGVPEYIALQKLKLGQDLNTPIPGEYGSTYGANASAPAGPATTTAPVTPDTNAGGTATLRQISQARGIPVDELVMASGGADPDAPLDFDQRQAVIGKLSAGTGQPARVATAGATTTVPTPADAPAAFSGRFPGVTTTPGGASGITPPPRAPFPPSVGASNPAQPQVPVQTAQVQPPVAQAQAGPGVDQQVAEMQRQRAIADEAFKRGRAAAAIGDDALAKQFNSRAEAASNVANDINKSLLERAMPTQAAKDARDAAVRQAKFAEEGDKADVASFEKSYGQASSLANAAPAGLGRVEEMKALIQAPNYYSGPLNKGVQTFQQYRAAFGRDPSTAQPMEAFNKGVKDIVTEQIRALAGSGVGRVLQSEVRNIQSAVATLDNSPAGNRSQLETLRRTYQLQAGIGQVADQVRTAVARGQVSPGQAQAVFNQAVRQYTETHPSFTPEEIKHPTLIGAPDAPADYARMSIPQRRQWGAAHNVQPNDAIRLSNGVGQPWSYGHAD